MKIENSNIIQASLIKELDKAWLLDCEGDKIWFPKSKCNFDQVKQELEAPIWLLREKFPTENF